MVQQSSSFAGNKQKTLCKQKQQQRHGMDDTAAEQQLRWQHPKTRTVAKAAINKHQQTSAEQQQGRPPCERSSIEVWRTRASNRILVYTKHNTHPDERAPDHGDDLRKVRQPRVGVQSHAHAELHLVQILYLPLSLIFSCPLLVSML